VTATYRVGSGKSAAAAGTLTTILKPYPGLKSIVNPVPPGGGDDPEPTDNIKQAAPASVLYFGRVISLQDYEVTALRAPGVLKTRARWMWDTGRQGAIVKVLVIIDETQDEETVIEGVKAQLHNRGDPNRVPAVEPAVRRELNLTVTLTVNERYLTEDIHRRAGSALLDPKNGLLGIQHIEIGRSLFRSELIQALLAVDGIDGVIRIRANLGDFPLIIQENQYLAVKNLRFN
jgi:hypothetical protein